MFANMSDLLVLGIRTPFPRDAVFRSMSCHSCSGLWPCRRVQSQLFHPQRVRSLENQRGYYSSEIVQILPEATVQSRANFLQRDFGKLSLVDTGDGFLSTLTCRKLHLLLL